MTSGVRETPRLARQLSNALDLAAALIAVGLLTLSYAGESGLLRIFLALAFSFFVPGRAIVTNWPRMVSWSETALSMVLSLAVLTLLATVTLWAHVWKPTDLFQVEAWLSLCGLCLGAVRRNKPRPGRSARES